MKVYKTLDSLLPDNATVLNNMAWLMLNSDVRQGIVYAERALKIEPGNPFIQDTLAMLRLKNGEPEKALNFSEKSAKAKPNAVDIQINYAKVLSANNKKGKARDLLNNLLGRVKTAKQKQSIRDAIRSL